MSWLIHHPPMLPLIFMGYALSLISIMFYIIWKDCIKCYTSK